MVAERIKGITVEIAGDTIKLNDALRETDKQITNTQKSLKDVERLLKMDPGNTELIAQKQRLLTEAVDQTATRLDALKEAQAGFGPIDDKNRSQYEALGREIIATEQRLESLKTAAKKANEEISDIGKAAANISGGAGKVAQATKSLTTGVMGLGAAVVATVPATEELRTDLSRLDNSANQAGVSIDKTREAFTAFNVVSDEVDSSVEATANLLQAGFTESNLQKAVEGLAGAYLAFPDTLKIEGLADSLQETLATGTATGQFGELLDRLGIGAENFGNALAECTTDAEKQNLVLQTLADAGLMDSYNAWKDNNAALVEGKEASAEMQQSMAELAESIQPAVTMATNLATTFLNWFNNLSAGQKGAIAALLAIVAAISPIATVVSTVSGAIAIFTGAATTGTAAATGLAGALTFITGPAGIVIAIIGAVIAAVVLLWNNCEGFRTAVTTAWEAIKAAFQTFIDWLQATFAPVWDAVVGALQAVFDAFKQALAIAWQNIQVIFEMFGTFLQEVFGVTWSDVFAGIQTVIQTVGSVIQTVVQTVTNIFRGLINFLTASFLTAWQTGWQNAVNFFSAFKDSVLQIINGVKTAFQGVIDFVAGVFTGDWQRAWEGVKNIFKGVFDALVGIVKIPLNGIIGLLNKAIGAINFLIDGLNKVVGLINALGGSIPTIPHIPTIAYLAKGGTLEAGSAVVGENGPELLSLLNGKARVTPLASSEGSGGTRDDRAAAAGYNQTLNFYTAAMTPSEVARQTRNATRKMIAGVSG